MPFCLFAVNYHHHVSLALGNQKKLANLEISKVLNKFLNLY